MFKKTTICILILLLLGCQSNIDSTTTVDKTTVFGLEEPTLTPEIFAPDIISTLETLEFAGTFSPDFTYFFFTRRNAEGINRLFYTEYINENWIQPVLSPISQDVAEFEPFITPDGKYLYFGSKRDNHDEFVIYRSEFTDGVWQEPIYLENELNDGFAMYISVSLNGNIYYTASNGIRVMRYVDEEYLPSESTGIYGAHPYIAPDESYMLFDNSGGYNLLTSIYISYNVDGEFQSAIKLGEEINNADNIQLCASVSPDGAYLFFCRVIEDLFDIYWVSADYLNDYQMNN